MRERYIQELYRLRQRRGVTLTEARTLIDNRNVFGSMMVHMGDADALVSGVTQHYPDTIRPALQIVRVREGLHKVSGCYAMITRKGDCVFPRRHQREHRADGRGPGGDRTVHRANGAAIRRGAAGGDAVVLQLWQHATSAVREGAAGGGIAAPRRSRR